MSSTIRNLIVALPLAAAAVTMAPATAMADGGDITLPLPGGDPQGPVIANPTPTPDPKPEGPGDLTAPQPCPTHGVVCGGNGGHDGGNGGDGTDGGKAGKGGHTGHDTGHPTGQVHSIALPTRIDAGLAPAQDQGANGLELTWLLAGGAMVTASGAAFATRRRVRA